MREICCICFVRLSTWFTLSLEAMSSRSSSTIVVTFSRVVSILLRAEFSMPSACAFISMLNCAISSVRAAMSVTSDSTSVVFWFIAAAFSDISAMVAEISSVSADIEAALSVEVCTLPRTSETTFSMSCVFPEMTLNMLWSLSINTLKPSRTAASSPLQRTLIRRVRSPSPRSMSEIIPRISFLTATNGRITNRTTTVTAAINAAALTRISTIVSRTESCETLFRSLRALSAPAVAEAMSFAATASTLSALSESSPFASAYAFSFSPAPLNASRSAR